MDMEKRAGTDKIKELRLYFAQQSDVAMAFLFGSVAEGRAMPESDADIAVYFWPAGRELEWEEQRLFPMEDRIWSDVEKIMGIRTDLVVLNRSASALAASVLEKGIPLVIKSRALYDRFLLMTGSAAEEFRGHVRDFWEVKQRSQSLNPSDKERLIRAADFMEGELKDYEHFTGLDQRAYLADAAVKRNVERWAENIVNASIDMAKILLASEQKRIPQTYRELLEEMQLLEGFELSLASGLSRFAKLRNILAHEYLDVRFNHIREFIIEGVPLYKQFLAYAKSYISEA